MAEKGVTVTSPKSLVPEKRFRIGEIVQHLGIGRQTLHNYTMLGLIEPVARTRGGHRLYNEDVFKRLARIDEMKTRGMKLLEIRDAFQAEDRSSERSVEC
ncbi:MAG: MerR family transcriptional regulator [Planctomycetota bacterium]|nr:MAG: MerR family transcriptional regulator [Planctomycetota bacterium]